MSEPVAKKPNYAQMWFVVYNILVLLALIIAIGFTASSKLEDLQRRVGQLEQQCK